MSPTMTAAAWRVRHEGSPKAIENLTFEEVAQGLVDAQWEPTDEVLGPNDPDWVAIENHPLLEEIAADIEPPPARPFDDETRLDMNAMIDVCLVLLVFFILTTSYAALTKRLDMPDVDPTDPNKMTVIRAKDIPHSMIRASVTVENGKPVFRVENNQISPDLLAAELTRYVGNTHKTILLLEHNDEVPHGAVVKVQDAAKGAGMSKVLIVVPQK